MGLIKCETATPITLIARCLAIFDHEHHQRHVTQVVFRQIGMFKEVLTRTPCTTG